MSNGIKISNIKATPPPNIVDKIELTRVHKEFDGDAYFPEIPLDIFELINEENYNSDLENEFDYSYLTYKKR